MLKPVPMDSVRLPSRSVVPVEAGTLTLPDENPPSMERTGKLELRSRLTKLSFVSALPKPGKLTEPSLEPRSKRLLSESGRTGRLSELRPCPAKLIEPRLKNEPHVGSCVLREESAVVKLAARGSVAAAVFGPARVVDVVVLAAVVGGP